MELKDILHLQSEFDAHHHSSRPWNEPITAENVDLLEHLMVCLMGEIGECANLVKKVVRGDRSYAEIRPDFTMEVVDSFIYLIKICNQTGIDLEQGFLDRLRWNQERFRKYSTSE